MKIVCLIPLFLFWSLFWCLIENGSGSEVYYCPEAPETPEDRRTDKSILKVASLNTEWLFSGLHGGIGPRKNVTQGDEHLADVLTTIKRVNADIFVLLEVEDCGMLQRVVDGFPDAKYKPYMVKSTDTATKQQVGIVTRVDPVTNIMRTTERSEYPQNNSRCGYTSSVKTTGVTKHFYTSFVISGVDVSLIGTHLLARPTDAKQCAKREGQAAVLSDLISGTVLSGKRSSLLMVMGDLNDYSSDILDSYGWVPNSNVVSTLKNSTLSYPEQMGPMINVMGKMNRSERYSNWYDRNGNNIDDGSNEHSEIDHMLISATAFHDEGKGWKFVSAQIDHEQDPHENDHWPVITSLECIGCDEGPQESVAEDESPSSWLNSTEGAITMTACALVLVAFVFGCGWQFRKLKRNNSPHSESNFTRLWFSVFPRKRGFDTLK